MHGIHWSLLCHSVAIFLACKSAANECSISGDPRGKPESMNNDGRNYINIFTTLTFQYNGRVTHFDYVAHTTGNAYISFWDYGEEQMTTFVMKGKIHVETRNVGYNSYEVPNQDRIDVNAGDMIAVHYGATPRGFFVYERGDWNLTAGISLSDLHLTRTGAESENNEEWHVGEQLTLNGQAPMKTVALRIFYNCTCPSNKFGNNCSQSCSVNCIDPDNCMPENGVCVGGCAAGYEGPSCANGCPSNKFGNNCSQSCSVNCIDPDNCMPENGACVGGCAAGYEGPSCANACPSNKFGNNCSQSCSVNCIDPDNCMPENGACVGGCVAGYESPSCANEYESQDPVSEDPASSKGLIAGVVVAVVVIITALVVIVVVFARKRAKQKKYLESNCDTSDDFNNILNNAGPDPDVIRQPAANEVKSSNVTKKAIETKLGIESKISVIKPAISKKPEIQKSTKEEPTAAYTNSNGNLSHPTKVANFGEFMAKQKVSDCANLQEEYMTLPIGQTAPWDVAKHSGLILKNKFKNILPYDKNRVVLEIVEDNQLSHYINASFVDGYTKENKFIASHGPREHTKDDFWRMIWQYDVAVIVMVTNLVEEGREKCVKYWPVDGKRSYGEITVTPKAEEQWYDYVVREFTIAKGKDERQVSQFHYIGWPDHGVPMHSSGLLTMVHRVKSHISRHETSPVVVHCSAGVGRTGTFIALDWLLDQAEKEKEVDILQCVAKLRTFRINMVQSSAQYVFIYDTMNEILLLGQTSICCNEIDDVYQNLSDSKKREDKLEVQYKYLDDTKPYFLDEEFDTATSAVNKKQNRDLSILPAEKHRVALTIGGSETYINTVSVQGYRTESKYYATQLPLAETADCFWQMTWEHQITTVVVLETTDDCEWFPKEGESLFCGDSEIRTTYVNKQRGFFIYTIELSQHPAATEYYNMTTNQGQVRVISLFVLDASNERDIGTPIISMYIEILRQTPTEHSTTAVLCRNGARLTGLYIACCILFDMCSTEQEFDVFQVVQKIRRTRPQFIGSLEQYKQLYEIVKEFSATESEYCNVK